MLTLIKERRENIKNILKKIAKYSHMSTRKALNEMFFFIVYMLRHADILTASKIAVFYDLGEEEIAFVAGDRRAREIKEFARKHGLKRPVEEIEVFKAFERKELKEEVKEAVKEIERVEEEIEKSEEEVKEAKRVRRKRKKKEKEKSEVTLDKFFS